MFGFLREKQFQLENRIKREKMAYIKQMFDSQEQLLNDNMIRTFFIIFHSLFLSLLCSRVFYNIFFVFIVQVYFFSQFFLYIYYPTFFISLLIVLHFFILRRYSLHLFYIPCLHLYYPVLFLSSLVFL